MSVKLTTTTVQKQHFSFYLKRIKNKKIHFHLRTPVETIGKYLEYYSYLIGTKQINLGTL